VDSIARNERLIALLEKRNKTIEEDYLEIDWERLQAEEGFTGAESTVRKYVGRRRRELGLNVKEVYIEQEHQPGREAQVDFGEADVKLDGVLITVHLLLVRCCYSGKTFAMAFRRQTQQAFLEGLVRALSYFGGVFEWLRFDNLKAAVKKVLRGRNRKETDRFVALRSHYLFKSVFCRPGKEEEDGFFCGDDRSCWAGICVANVCGDGRLQEDSDEQCDDGDTDEKNGCTTECTWSCESNADCEGGDPCAGADTCSADHTCVCDGLRCGATCVLGGVCCDSSDCGTGD